MKKDIAIAGVGGQGSLFANQRALPIRHCGRD